MFNEALTFDDVLLVPNFNNISSRKEVDTSVKLSHPDCIRLGIPIISSNMDTITGSKMTEAMYNAGGMGILHRFCTIEENVELFYKNELCGVSVGVSKQEITRIDTLANLDKSLWVVCVDVAHGHSEEVAKMVTYIKNKYGYRMYIIAGNVCTKEGAVFLKQAGADCVKVGIGPGSVCSTRIQTGCGYPQLGAIMECSRVDVDIIADGGCRTPGDIVKALAAGADMVMLGGMLAGTDECPMPGLYRGMASREANEEYYGSMPSYKAAEGISVAATSRGPVKNIIDNIMGGVRSGMTYCGARTLKELRTNAKWVRVTHSGKIEGTPHYNA